MKRAMSYYLVHYGKRDTLLLLTFFCSVLPVSARKNWHIKHDPQRELNAIMAEVASHRLSVTLSSSDLVIGDSVTITVLAPSSDFRPRGGITISISGTGVEFYHLRSPGSITIPALNCGEYRIWASASGINSSEEQLLVMHYPDVDMIMRDSTVRCRFNELWEKTLASATDSSCREFGAVVYANTVDGILRYDMETFDGEQLSYQYGGLTFITSDNDIASKLISAGGRWAVLIFHTHPPFWNCHSEQPIMRLCGPSRPDTESFYVTIGIPHVVRDFLGSPNRMNAMMHRSNTRPGDSENRVLDYAFGRFRRPYTLQI